MRVVAPVDPCLWCPSTLRRLGQPVYGVRAPECGACLGTAVPVGHPTVDSRPSAAYPDNPDLCKYPVWLCSRSPLEPAHTWPRRRQGGASSPGQRPPCGRGSFTCAGARFGLRLVHVSPAPDAVTEGRFEARAWRRVRGSVRRARRGGSRGHAVCSRGGGSTPDAAARAGVLLAMGDSRDSWPCLDRSTHGRLEVPTNNLPALGGRRPAKD